MRKIDFSLVIPVYNTPKEDIRNCLESIRTNHRCSYEILLIDDGSSRQTAEFLDMLAEQAEEIRVFHQKNGGVSRARNAGTKKAQGDYVSYVDSDDLLMPGILDSLLPILKENKPDLLITPIARERGASEAEARYETGGEELKAELREYYLTFENPRFRTETAWINRAPHGRFLKRELALQAEYPEDLAFGEDVLWNFELLNRTGKILLYFRQGYCYREVKSSATQKYRPDFPREVRSLLERYRKEIRKWPGKRPELYYVSAVEYFTILMRVYVFAGEKRTAWKRYQQEISSDFWRNIFRKVPLSKLRGRYRLAALLGKCHLDGVLYLMFRIHHS